jgi:hypothetical protein
MASHSTLGAVKSRRRWNYGLLQMMVLPVISGRN